MNVEQAFKIARSVAEMRAATVRLDKELKDIGASVSQHRMVDNIDQALSALEHSLRPLLPTDEAETSG